MHIYIVHRYIDRQIARLSIYLSVYLSIYLSICLSISVCLSVCRLVICLCLCLSLFVSSRTPPPRARARFDIILYVVVSMARIIKKLLKYLGNPDGGVPRGPQGSPGGGLGVPRGLGGPQGEPGGTRRGVPRGGSWGRRPPLL